MAASTVPVTGRCKAPSTHAPGKRLCDGTQGYDGHSVTDSTFPMPLVAQLAAGFGSLAVRSIRNAAEWTLDTWCATVDAHPGGDAPALAEFRVPAGSGAPGRKHDYSRAGPRSNAVRCRRFARASGKT